MPPHANYKYILFQSLLLSGIIHPPDWTRHCSAEHTATQTADHCPWGAIYKWVSCPSSLWLVLDASFSLVTGEVLLACIGWTRGQLVSSWRAIPEGWDSDSALLSLPRQRFLPLWLCKVTQTMFPWVSPKFGIMVRRKWQLVSGIDKIHHVSPGEVSFFSLFVFWWVVGGWKKW